MSMEFAIQTLSGNGTVLSESERFWLDHGNRDDDAFDFVPLQIRVASSGAKAFQVGEDDMVQAPLVAYVIDSVKIRSYYPSRTGSKIPLCSSVGGKYGMFNLAYADMDLADASVFPRPHPAVEAIGNDGPVEDFYECALCPLSQFGSALEGAGQACKVKQRLLVLPEGWSSPAILVLPTMSVMGWNRFCSMVQTKFHRPYFSYKIAFKVEKKENSDNQPYGVVIPEIVAPIEDSAQGKAVVELQNALRTYVRNRPVQADEDIGGNGE